MDPILATGLVSLGRELIHKINSPKPSPEKVDFQTVLDEEKLSSTNPRSLAQLNQVRQALANSPEVHALLTGDTKGVWLSELADGGLAISTDSAGTVRIPSGSPTESLAREFYSLSKNLNGSSSVMASGADSFWVNASL